MKLPFGKHKGEDTADVPLDYLKWLEEQDWVSDSLREECQYQIRRQDGDVTSIGRVVKP